MKLIIAGVCCLLILTCAGADSGKSNRIVGGQTAYVGQFPHQVSLRESTNNEHFCGGSILDPTTILTSAQCVCGYKAKPCSYIVSGTNKLSEGGSYHSVSRIVCHPNFKSDRPSINDLAIIKLQTRMQFSDSVQPVRLPYRNIGEDEKFTLSGWGWVSLSLAFSDINIKKSDNLQYITLKSISFNTCSSLLGPLDKTNVLANPSYQFCTIPEGVYVGGACKGDTGGALVDEDGVQYGIISWIYNCNGRPDIFTNVRYYRSWIESEMYT